MYMNNDKKIINKDIDSLVFAEYNPRQLTKEQFKYLKESIDRFGFVDPIIINKNKDRKNIIIGGHQRCKVAKEMGIKEIPCLELDLDYDKERELNVRLNKNTGDWDFDLLANHFDIDELIDWGFDNKELTGLGEMILPDEKALEEPEINMNVIVSLEMTKERYFELKDQINSMEKDGVTINIS